MGADKTVAEHFSPHTTTYQSPPTPASLYPQYTGQFSRFDNPSTEQDWAMRQAGEERLKTLLSHAQGSGITYGRQYVLMSTNAGVND